MADKATNITQAAESFTPGQTAGSIIEICFLSLLLAIGGPLNVFSLYRSVRSYRLKNQTLMLLKIHLNIADLLILFVYSLSEIIWLSVIQWYGGALLCKLVKYLHLFSFALQSSVVTIIAMDRCISVIHLHSQSYQKTKTLKGLIVCAWTYAALCSCPQIFTHSTLEPWPTRHPGWSQCVTIWRIIRFTSPNATQGLFVDEVVLAYSHVVLVYWIPVAIILSCYVFMICRINKLYNAEMVKAATSKTNLHVEMSSCLRMSVASQGQPEAKPNSPLLEKNDQARPKYRADSASQKEMQVLLQCRKSPTEVHSQAVPAATDIGSPKSTKNRHSHHFFRKTFAAATLSRAKSNSLRTALLIAAAFGFFWTPYNIVTFLQIGHWNAHEWTRVLEQLMIANCIVNPLIYGIKKQA